MCKGVKIKPFYYVIRQDKFLLLLITIYNNILFKTLYYPLIKLNEITEVNHREKTFYKLFIKIESLFIIKISCDLINIIKPFFLNIL